MGMSDAATIGGHIVVIDHTPKPTLIESLRTQGFVTTILSEQALDAAHLQALSNVDAVLIADNHPRMSFLFDALKMARLEAPLVVLCEKGVSPIHAKDVLHEAPSNEELRTLYWLVRAERARRDKRAAEVEANDAVYLAELGKVVTQVAHEIRNPLTALSAKLQWLKRKAEGAEIVVRTSDGMLDEVHRLARMLNDMLEFGRSRTFSKRTSSEVARTLDEVVALYRETCENARVNLILEQSNDVRLRVPFPAEELHQVFQNLLTNAIDATPPDETITIAVGQQTDGRMRVEFRNPGHLPADIQSKAFELFFTTKPNGTGLGLPIVKRIVGGVSGEVEALNVGDHVVIRLTLPVVM
jgi:signal transduction histidine kinase